jgi:hypothetical protein
MAIYLPGMDCLITGTLTTERPDEPRQPQAAVGHIDEMTRRWSPQAAVDHTDDSDRRCHITPKAGGYIDAKGHRWEAPHLSPQDLHKKKAHFT